MSLVTIAFWYRRKPGLLHIHADADLPENETAT
jgi:hypothetical protein